MNSLRCRHLPIKLRHSISEELPRIPQFAYQLEIHVGDDDFVLVAAGLLEDFAARVEEVERIAFNAGSLTASIVMSRSDYMRAAQPGLVFAFSE